MKVLAFLTAAVLISTSACSRGVTVDPVNTTPPTSSVLSTSSSTSVATSTTVATTTTSPASSSTAGDPIAPSGAGSQACWSSPVEVGNGPISLDDVTASLGLIDPLLGMHGHAAAWGDVNRDGWPDLYVGTFADRPDENYRSRGASGPAPDRLLMGGPDGFSLASEFPEDSWRAAGAVFANLDSDEEQELVVAQNERRGDSGPGTSILDRQDDGWRRIELPVELGARAIGVFDADGDGLLDLFVTEDRWTGGSSRLLQNRGDLEFVDITERAGLPGDIHGLGVATSDLDGDGSADIFVSGSNRLFVNRGGSFREVTTDVFDWDYFGDEDDVAGVTVADLNRDSRPDLVLGQHFNSTVDGDRRVPIRLYLNQGSSDGKLAFRDVTDQAGLIGLPTKAPHVEIVDMDNDGWPDIVTSASAGEGERPAVFMHQGVEENVPRFRPPEGLGSDQYWVTGGAADVDRDGRQDLFLVEWEPALPSLLLRNTTSGGHWLSIGAAVADWGPGTVVEIYEEGRAGEPEALIGAREVVVATGYAAGVPPAAHFGLGQLEVVDVVVTGPTGQSQTLPRMKVDQHIELGAC